MLNITQRIIGILFWVACASTLYPAHTLQFQRQQTKHYFMFGPQAPAATTFNITISHAPSYRQLALSHSQTMNLQAVQTALKQAMAQTTTAQLNLHTQRHETIVAGLPGILLKPSSAQLYHGLPELKAHHAPRLAYRQAFLERHKLPEATRMLKPQQIQALPAREAYAFQENEIQLNHIGFLIDIKSQNLAHNNKLSWQYEMDMRKAETAYATKTVDTQSLPFLEKEQANLKAFISKHAPLLTEAQQIKAAYPGKMAAIQKKRGNLSWSAGKEWEALAAKENKLTAKLERANKTIEFASKHLSACEAELKRIEPLIAYGKQCEKQVAEENARLEKQVQTIAPKELTAQLTEIDTRADKIIAEHSNNEQAKAYAEATKQCCLTAFDMIQMGTLQRAHAFTSLASVLDQTTLNVLGLVSNHRHLDTLMRQTTGLLTYHASNDPQWFENIENVYKKHAKLAPKRQMFHGITHLVEYLVPEIQSFYDNDHNNENLLDTVTYIRRATGETESQSLNDTTQDPFLTTWRKATASLPAHIAYFKAARQKAHAAQATEVKQTQADQKTPPQTTHASHGLGLMAAVRQMHQDPRAIHAATYALEHNSVYNLTTLGFKPEEFSERYTGNHVQHYVHGKLITSLNKVGKFSTGSLEKVEVQKLLRGAVVLNQTGQNLNNNHHTKQALSAHHACDMVIDYAKTIADLGLAVGEGAVAGVKSTLSTLGKIGKTTLDAATFPEEFIPRVRDTFNKATLAVSKFAAVVREDLTLMAKHDSASMHEFAQRREARGKQLEALSQALSKKYHDTPLREKVKIVSQLFTEFECLGVMGEALCETATLQQAGVTVEEMILQPQQALTREVIDVTIHTVSHEPTLVKAALESAQHDSTFLTVTKSSQESISKHFTAYFEKFDPYKASPGYLNISDKPKALPAAIAETTVQTTAPAVSQTAHVERKITAAAQVSESVARTVAVETKAVAAAEHMVQATEFMKNGFKAVADTHGNTIGKIDLIPISPPTSKEFYHHVFRAWENKKREKLVGCHILIKQPGLLDQIIKEPNQHGIQKVIMKKGLCVSQKTIGPDNWNQLEYARRLKEAYSNIVSKATTRENTIRLLGLDKEGIPWEMYIELKENVYKLTTGYPKYV